MKKLIFLFAFAFFGQQAFSQIYMAALTNISSAHPSGCTSQYALVKIDPSGNLTYDCISHTSLLNDPSPLAQINIALNSIINQGYKLIKITDPGGDSGDDTGGLTGGYHIITGTVWYFAIP